MSKDSVDQNERIARLGAELDAVREQLVRAQSSGGGGGGGGAAHNNNHHNNNKLSSSLDADELQREGVMSGGGGSSSSSSGGRMVSDAELDSLHRTIAVLRHQITVLSARTHTRITTSTASAPTSKSTSASTTTTTTTTTLLGLSTNELLQSLPPLPLTEQRRALVALTTNTPALQTPIEQTAHAIHQQMRARSSAASSGDLTADFTSSSSSSVSTSSSSSTTASASASTGGGAPLHSLQNDLNKLMSQVQRFRCSPVVVNVAGAKDKDKERKAGTDSKTDAAVHAPLQQWLARRAQASRLQQQAEQVHQRLTEELDSNHKLSRTTEVPATVSGLRLIGRVRKVSGVASAPPERVLVNNIEQLARIFVA